MENQRWRNEAVPGVLFLWNLQTGAVAHVPLLKVGLAGLDA